MILSPEIERKSQLNPSILNGENAPNSVGRGSHFTKLRLLPNIEGELLRSSGVQPFDGGTEVFTFGKQMLDSLSKVLRDQSPE